MPNVLGILVGYDHGNIVKSMPIHSWENVVQTALDSGPVFDECTIFALIPHDAEDIEIQGQKTYLSYPSGHVENYPVVALYHHVPESYHGADVHHGNGAYHSKAEKTRTKMQSAEF